MGYAVKNDNLGFRAVDSANDIGVGEYYSETIPQAYYTNIANQEHNSLILEQIKAIELQQARALRESIVGTEAVKLQAAQYLKQYDDQIIALRSQLL